jgi:hypothetical protein
MKDEAPEFQASRRLVNGAVWWRWGRVELPYQGSDKPRRVADGPQSTPPSGWEQSSSGQDRGVSATIQLSVLPPAPTTKGDT